MVKGYTVRRYERYRDSTDLWVQLVNCGYNNCGVQRREDHYVLLIWQPTVNQ